MVVSCVKTSCMGTLADYENPRLFIAAENLHTGLVYSEKKKY